MAKLIDVTENGSNRKLSIVISNILYVEPLTYRNNITVTVITLVDKSTIHVDESIVAVKGIINAS